MRRHLRGKRHGDAAIDEAIAKLTERGYLDDLEFARYWVEHRSRFRPKGERVLVGELRAKGVERDAVEAALQEQSAEPEVERARRAIARSLRRWATLDPAERRRKIYAFLAARGFDFDVIDEVIARPGGET